MVVSGYHDGDEGYKEWRKPEYEQDLWSVASANFDFLPNNNNHGPQVIFDSMLFRCNPVFKLFPTFRFLDSTVLFCIGVKLWRIVIIKRFNIYLASLYDSIQEGLVAEKIPICHLIVKQSSIFDSKCHTDLSRTWELNAQKRRTIW